MICLVSNTPVKGMVGAARAGARRREAAVQLGREEGSPGTFCRCLCCHHCRSLDGVGINVTRGIGGGGSATVVASFVPLLSDGKLLYGGSDVVVIIMPSPQILPPGAGAIVKSHLAAINGHQRRCSLAMTMITLMTVNASAALSSSDALPSLTPSRRQSGTRTPPLLPSSPLPPLVRLSTVTLPVPDLIKLF